MFLTLAKVVDMLKENIRLAFSYTDGPSGKCEIVNGNRLQNCILYEHPDFVIRAIGLKYV